MTGQTIPARREHPADQLVRAADGDEEAFASFYDAYVGTVFGRCYRATRDSAQAERMTMEIFVRAWTHSAGFDPTAESADTWLCGLAALDPAGEAT